MFYQLKKKIFFAVFCFFAFSVFCNSQNVEKVEQFSLSNGIPVYIKSNEQSDMLALYLVLDGGIFYLTPQTSGLEEVTIKMLSMGSKNYSYAELKDFYFNTQGDINSYSINDGSVFGLSCITKYFEETFMRFEDAFFNPLFSEKEYSLLMQIYRQKIHSAMNDPQELLFYEMEKDIYKNHPFSSKSNPTQDSIQNITLEAIKTYYKSLIDSRRLSFVVAGNVDKQTLSNLLNRKFGTISSLSTPIKDKTVSPFDFEGENLVLTNKNADGAGFVMRVFSSPNVDDEDYPKARIVASIFSDILHNVVREKYGVCYSSFSTVTSSSCAYGVDFLYNVIDYENYKSAYEEALSIMKEGKTISARDSKGNFIFEPIQSRLNGYVNSYITSKYSTQATISGVAGRLAASLLQFNYIDKGSQLTIIAKSITSEDVMRIFDKYWLAEKSKWYAVVGEGVEISF